MQEHKDRYNLNIKKWGSAGWIYLMAIALTYPDSPTDKDKDNYKNFFTANQFVIPCPACRQHYATNLQRFPLNDEALASRRSLAAWIHRMRNEVNKLKQTPEVDFLQFLSDYLTPSMASSMLTTDELTRLTAIDTEKNIAYSKSKEDKKEKHHREQFNYWWILGGLFGLLLLLFVFVAIKSALTNK